jgi:hypothetical protein
MNTQAMNIKDYMQGIGIEARQASRAMAAANTEPRVSGRSLTSLILSVK